MIWVILVFVACALSIVGIQNYFSVEKEIVAVMYGGVITVFGSMLSLVIGRQVENKAAHERHMIEKKIQVYQDLVDHVLDFTIEKTKEERSDIKNAKAMTRSLITWGSDDALKKWIGYIVSIRGDYKDSLGSLEILSEDILEKFL